MKNCAGKLQSWLSGNHHKNLKPLTETQKEIENDLGYTVLLAGRDREPDDSGVLLYLGYGLTRLEFIWEGDRVIATFHVLRPGIFIGKGGSHIDLVREMLKRVYPLVEVGVVEVVPWKSHKLNQPA